MIASLSNFPDPCPKCGGTGYIETEYYSTDSSWFTGTNFSEVRIGPTPEEKEQMRLKNDKDSQQSILEMIPRRELFFSRALPPRDVPRKLPCWSANRWRSLT